MARGINEAVKLFKLSVAKEYANAEWILGDCYTDGTGVEENLDTAF